MDRPKPSRVPKEYAEGPEAASQFDRMVHRVIAVPHSEVKKRHEAWQKTHKTQKQRSR